MPIELWLPMVIISGCLIVLAAVFCRKGEK